MAAVPSLISRGENAEAAIVHNHGVFKELSYSDLAFPYGLSSVSEIVWAVIVPTSGDNAQSLESS